MEHRYEGKASAEQQAAGKQPAHGFSSREGAAVVEEMAATWHVLHVHGGLRMRFWEYIVVINHFVFSVFVPAVISPVGKRSLA